MYARVAVARPVEGLFTYSVPAVLDATLRLGHAVLVPFGKGKETGWVVERLAEPDLPPEKVRPVARLIDPEPVFDERQLGFFRWMADYYLAPLGVVIRTALPAQTQAKVVPVIQPTEQGVEALADGRLEPHLAQAIREVIARPGLTRKGLVGRLVPEADAAAVERAVDALLRRGFAEWGERESREASGRVKTAVLAVPLEEALRKLPRAGPRMRAVLEVLARASGPVDLPAILADQGGDAGPVVRRLAQAGVVRTGARERRDPLADAGPLGPSTAPDLNPDQGRALDVLRAPEASGVHLLFGVTGSGKTEVFLGAASAVLARDRQVLVLVPEIGLTPQLVGRFRARFGDGVAVLHSGLAGGERLAQWRRIRAGEARVAVGARSALFAPFASLGLIVVDEEHDDSYKQDDGVRYNARDLAVVLGRRHGCPVVLASATPSLESWHNAQVGRYVLHRLPNRATPRPVPLVERVDLSALEIPDGGTRPVFSPLAVEVLSEAFRAGGKAIVLYNRRGYATMVECAHCGGTYECPNCGITLTLHRAIRVLSCHYCGFKRPWTDECPQCHRPELTEVGKGTERVEEEVAKLFPEVPILRMDADTTAVRGSHHRILAEFRKPGPAALVGTQIVAKGHDFPDVLAAVVVSADHGFRFPDFRAAERTFSLLVQVSGRAGRGDVPGRVVVQTWKPDHYALAHLDDVERFLEAEARIRSTLRYPPFARLCLLRLEGADRKTVASTASKLASELRVDARTADGVDVLGPAPAALPRLVGRWRFQIVLRGRDTAPFRRFLAAARTRIECAGSQGVRLLVDVDPRHLL